MTVRLHYFVNVGHSVGAYHNKDRSYVRETQQDRVWLAKPAGLFGDESLLYYQPSALGSIYWVCCSNVMSLCPLHVFNIQHKRTGKYHRMACWVFSVIRLKIIWLVCAFVWQREESVLGLGVGGGTLPCAVGCVCACVRVILLSRTLS